MIYREYTSGELARPAFTQELRHDLSHQMEMMPPPDRAGLKTGGAESRRDFVTPIIGTPACRAVARRHGAWETDAAEEGF
ncbi:MAG: hypothetical protein EON59_06825 [Alphaproteobacteria bacterium]|nr:MAG: hypothetical protein EON59_06825 [Alphaproteobacteria bacterium]